MKETTFTLKPLAFVMATCSLSGLANADTSQHPLEEVMVYAQKRAERMIDVPISITALSGDDLKAASAISLSDITGLVPNLLFQELGSNSASLFAIRGFGSDTTNPGLESGVAAYIDGVYLGRSAAFNSALLDLETVEVLRGPQGTTYGRNSILGAFNIISNKPTDEMEGSVEVGMGNYDLKQTKGVFNLPINDSFALRFAGLTTSRDGYLENRVTGSDINDMDTVGGRIIAQYEPSDDLTVLLSVDGQKDRSNGLSKEAATNGPDDYDSISDRKIDVTDIEEDDRDIFGTALTVNYAMGDYQLTSITAYRETDNTVVQDVDYMPEDLIRGAGDLQQDQFSQELRIDSLAGERLTWTAGLYYFTQDWTNIGGFVFDASVLGGPPGEIVNLDSRSSETTDAYAVFGSATYAITDQLSVTAGLRYTDETKTRRYGQTLELGGEPIDLGGPFVNIAEFKDSGSDSNTSPSLVFNYAWDEQLNTYIKVVQGFKSGGFNSAFGASPVGSDFDAETLTSYEAGIKGTRMDGKLSFNAAFFYIDYQDIQVNNSTSFGQTIVTNDEEATNTGFEVDVTLNATDNLRLSAAAGYTDYRDQPVPEPAYQPEWTGSLGADYNVALSDGVQMFMHGDLTYRSSFHSTRAHLFSNSDTVLVNARAGVDLSGGDWQIYVWGRNLNDELVFSNTIPDSLIVSNLEAPRTYGIGATFNF